MHSSSKRTFNKIHYTTFIWFSRSNTRKASDKLSSNTSKVNNPYPILLADSEQSTCFLSNDEQHTAVADRTQFVSIDTITLGRGLRYIADRADCGTHTRSSPARARGPSLRPIWYRRPTHHVVVCGLTSFVDGVTYVVAVPHGVRPEADGSSAASMKDQLYTATD